MRRNPCRATRESPSAATKTQRSQKQINEYNFFKKRGRVNLRKETKKGEREVLVTPYLIQFALGLISKTRLVC